MEKKSNLKKLLATASAFAVIAGASTSASATAFVTAGAATINTGNATANMATDAAFADGDTVAFGGAHSLTIGTAATSVGAITIAGNAGTTIVVNGATTLTAVSDTGVNTSDTTVNDAKTLTLTGTTFGGLGDITLGSANTAAANLVVNGNMALGGTIDSDGGNNLGILTINSGKTVTFSGIIGATNELAKINLDTGANGASSSTFKGAVSSTAISLDGGTASFEGAVTGATTSTAQGGTLTVAGLHTGALDLTLGTTTVSTAAVTGAVALGDAATLTATGTITGTVTSPAAATGGSITGTTLAGNLDLTNGGTAKFTGNITDGAANGHVILGSTAQATLSGTVSGNVTTIGKSLILGSAATTNVTGNVSINTSNSTTNTLGDVTGTVALVAGKLTMGNAVDAVTVTAGTLNMGKATGAVTVNGGTVETLGTVGGALTVANDAVVETVGNVTGNAAASGTSTITATGTVGGTLGITGSALFTGSLTATDVAGDTTINTLNDGINKLHNVTGGTVTLTKGLLTMNNATGGAVTVTAGTLVMNDVTGANAVQLDGGTSTINSIVNNLTMTADATATVAGHITGTTTTAAGNKLTLSGTGTNTGAITNVGTIVVQGARTFTAITTPGTINLEGTGASLAVAASLGAGVVTSDSTSGHNITSTAAQTLTGTIGSTTNPVNLIMNGDNAANINTANFHGSVTTATTGQASLVFGDTVDASVLSAGTAAKNLKVATFTESATVENGFYALATTVATGKTATIGGTVEGTSFALTNAGSVIFKDGVLLDVPVTVTVTANGSVTFEGDATISKAIGVVAGPLIPVQVNFNNTSSSIAKVGAAISATNINVNKGATVQLTAASTFTGATEITNGTLDLGAQSLTQAGDNMTINGASTIKSTLTAATTTAAITGGAITNAANNLVGGGSSTLTVSVVDTGVVRKQGGGRTFTLATANALTTFAADNLVSTAVTTNKLISWTAALSGNNIVLTEVDNAATYLKSKTTSHSAATIDALTAAADGTDAAAVVSLVEGFANADNTDKVTETIERLDKGSVIAADTVTTAMASVGDTLGTRAMAMNMPIRTASNGKVTGVAAGDDATKFGVWASPFYSRANQDERNGFAGYKNESYGASFGLDTKVNEDLTLGVAITASNSNIKHKDLKSGDRTKVNSLLFSIYNMQNITDSWFVSGSATFGTNDVENRSKRVSTTTAYQQADAKYSVTSFDLKQMFGYNYSMAQAVITPMIGAKYSRVGDASYTESGTTIQNLDIATKAFDKFELVAGVKASGESYDLGGVSVTPEAHAFVNYNLFNNSQKQSITLSGTKLSSNSDKAARAKYNLGLGLSSEYSAMEYGAAYDLQISDKRAGHQGSLKVRMNF